MPDADIDQAVEIAAAAVFSNNGVSHDQYKLIQLLGTM
jgi:hypothetical protein